MQREGFKTISLSLSLSLSLQYFCLFLNSLWVIKTSPSGAPKQARFACDMADGTQSASAERHSQPKNLRSKSLKSQKSRTSKGEDESSSEDDAEHFEVLEIWNEDHKAYIAKSKVSSASKINAPRLNARGAAKKEMEAVEQKNELTLGFS